MLLKDKNFRMDTPFLTATIERLIKCNLLFFNASKAVVTVQNRLLEKQIVHFLENVQQKRLVRLFEP